MDISMGKYYVFTVVALKRQKGDNVHVVKEYTERLIKALGTEIAGFSLQSTLSTPAYKNLNPIGSQLMRGTGTIMIDVIMIDLIAAKNPVLASGSLQGELGYALQVEEYWNPEKHEFARRSWPLDCNLESVSDDSSYKPSPLSTPRSMSNVASESDMDLEAEPRHTFEASDGADGAFRCAWIAGCQGFARRVVKLPRSARKDKESDHWSVLGVSPGASPSEVRTAFRAKARTVHPDAAGGDTERFHALSQAYAKAMKFKESNEETDSKAARSSKPARSQAAPEEKKEPTLEDFLQWRRRQQSRHAARRAGRAATQTTPRSSSRGPATRSPHASRKLRQGRLQDALRQAENPELEAAWLREVDMESLRMERSKKRSAKSKRSSAPTMMNDERVGYRSVRSPSGTVTVPIFQSKEGARYYMSPFTSKRVAIP
ncbi:unnamed protein product [Cladocopium goreaui]|uniref:J domain-containing protein n=1 Tax=Cladocopium goreaui TaxID=2562237 RepID=A0A9P1DF73_9DINO|nr:unnamed protein product [Cladocopium goreaui]